MVVPIEGSSCLEAWRLGCSALLDGGGELDNIITTILDPCSANPQGYRAFDPRGVSGSPDTVAHVARTIFPTGIWQVSANRADLYHRYKDSLLRTRQRGWGTYFERLIEFGAERDRQSVNQLERIIQRLSKWPGNYKAAFVMHTSAAHLDSPSPRGGPCLQYLQLIGAGNDVYDLVALYRNHDFFNKTLGNFVGLGQLLKFICDETGKHPGSLICHSVHAFIGSKGSRGRLRSLANL